MSNPIAFANGDSQIICTDGAQGTLCATNPNRFNWNSGTTQVTNSTSNTKVFVEGRPVSVQGDTMISHPDGLPCVVSPVFHAPATSLCAQKVTIGGKHIVRVGSKFNKNTTFDHTVSTGSGKVFVGGPNISV